jgi:hypothetical protein
MSDDLKARLRRGHLHRDPVTLGGVPHDRRCLEAADALDARDAEIARLREELAAEREDNLWNAYHAGVERDGRWSHAYKSEPEQLVRACGFDPKAAWYDAQTIKDLIPKLARTALNGGDH